MVVRRGGVGWLMVAVCGGLELKTNTLHRRYPHYEEFKNDQTTCWVSSGVVCGGWWWWLLVVCDGEGGKVLRKTFLELHA